MVQIQSKKPLLQRRHTDENRYPEDNNNDTKFVSYNRSLDTGLRWYDGAKFYIQFTCVQVAARITTWEIMMVDTFHDGERALQERTGEQDMAARNARLIIDHIPANARIFISKQVYCAIGSASPDGQIWASFMLGQHEFASTNEDGTSLYLQLPRKQEKSATLPPLKDLQPGNHIALLFIELATRRRLRINGKLIKIANGVLHLAVAEVYPNCPKYIQRRKLQFLHVSQSDFDVQTGKTLTEKLETWINNADTFFVASAHIKGQADVSHRGGKPGFVKIKNGVLHIPDYPGNSMFGTLGNFFTNPQAGLVFVDFKNNRQLQLSGQVRLDIMADEKTGNTGGTGRWWIFLTKKWFISALGKPVAWQLIDTSPHNP
ncbi:probable iron-sulfur binding protein YPO1417 [hydrothermal vent metagenome]|uniref:Probable iron-sulfur binding protein YPO1417 n=1 Tax=hydrothermal vent metagenome TaxID=652676 RepID=A0A3B0S3C9_9ZZZZ